MKDLLSIIIPIYKPNQRWLDECIDSCFSQEGDFDKEIICVYDGNFDEANKVRIREGVKYLCLEQHYGIANTLNAALDNASGKYIFIMNQDDICYPNRLQLQKEILDNNPDIDILGGGSTIIDKDGCVVDTYRPYTGYLTIDDLKENCYVSHPTVAMRKSSIDKLPYHYEHYYTPCEDYNFYLTALKYGLKIYNDSNFVIYYRRHKNQETSKSWNKMYDQTNRIRFRENSYEASADLTCIIPFKNEGEEVEKTIKSIMSTSQAKIIIINDGSEDDFDYDSIVSRFPLVTYIKHDKTQGSHASINEGVKNATTNYCIILDAHMRFYDNQWDEILLSYLNEHPNDLIYFNTAVIKKENNGLYDNEDGSHPLKRTSGGKIDLSCTDQNFTCRWAYNDVTENLQETSGMLGATYAFSKSHFENILGLNGLKNWGFVESMLVLKTWMMGGKCYRINNFSVGHIYRDNFPYKIPTNSTFSNEAYMIELFIQDEELKQKYYDYYITRFNKTKEDVDKLDINKEEIKYIQNKFIRTFKDYIEAYPECLKK